MCHEEIGGMLWSNGKVILKTSKHFSQMKWKKFKVIIHLIMVKKNVCIQVWAYIYFSNTMIGFFL